MRNSLTIAFFALLSMGTAQAGDADVTAGKVVYDTYCMSCHQADGKSMNGMLGANFVTDVERMKKSDEELTKSIVEGVTGTKGAMPPWGSVIDEKQTKDVLAYIRTFQKKE